MSIFKWLSSSLFCALTVLWAAQADAAYVIHTNAGNSTSIAVDQICNLTEAIASINLGNNINVDCADDGQGPWPPQYIYLDSGPGTPPVYKLSSTASQRTITQTQRAIFISTPSEYPAVVQASGAYVIRVSSSVTVTFQDLILKHTGTSSGRPLYNQGTVNAYFTTFQDGDVSTQACDATHFDSTSGCGGGVLNRGSLTLGFSTVQNNKANKGGGIFVGDADGSPRLVMNSSLIQNNTATGGGGGIYNELSSGGQGMDLYQSTLKGNWTMANGGGILSRDRVLAHNLTISANKAGCANLTSCSSFGTSGFGGGIYRDTSTGRYLEMTFSTIAFNEAVNGGGFHVSGVSTVGFTAFSIFAKNVIHVTMNKQPDVFGNPHNDTSKPKACMITDFGNNSNLTGDFQQDPLLRALAFDGWVWTHGLPSNSPALNRATRDEASLGDNADERAMARPAEATGTTVTDLGAFEYQPGSDPP